VAGVLSEAEALRLVALRGALMQELPGGGGMLAVGLGESEARAVAGERVSVAALNGAELTVLSGAGEALEAVARELNEQGVWSRRLETSHAFHSRLMEPMLEQYRAVLAGVELVKRIPDQGLPARA
jgi:acyl transferase domain-containing protein